MLRFKPEVRIGDCDERLWNVLRACALWSYRTRIEIEINSIEDGGGVHMTGSLHAVGLAVDVDTVGDKPADLDALADWLRVRLEPAYDVLYEGTHVHVEWDAHRGPLRKTVG